MWRQRLILGTLALVLAILTALGVAWYPHVLHGRFGSISGLLLATFWTGSMAVLVGHGCKLLDTVLESALSGARRIQVPEFEPGPAVMSFVKWTLCFIVGPAFLIYEAVRFWIQCGDVSLIDALILFELTVPAIGYWLVSVLVLAHDPERVHPTPWQVMKTLRRLGVYAIPAACAVTVVGFVHVWLGASAIVVLHRSPIAGLVLLWLCWFSVWQCGAFALRNLGAWFSHNRRPRSRPTVMRTS